MILDLENNIHFMVDLETLGTAADAVVMSLGVVKIVWHEDEEDFGRPYEIYGSDKFYRELNIQEQLDKGSKIEAETLRWWTQRVWEHGQSMPIFSLQPVAAIMRDLHAWLVARAGEKRVKLWAKGTDFDIPKLYNLQKMAGLGSPVWGYNDVLDYRTISKLYPDIRYPIARADISHNALHDALMQSHHLADIAFKKDWK